MTTSPIAGPRRQSPCVASLAARSALGRTLLPLLLALSSAPVAGEAAAAEAAQALPARHRIVWSNLLAARFNPIGVEDRVSVGYRYRLYDSASLLLRDANVHVAFTPVLNPTVTRLSGTLEVQPLAVLKLRASYGYLQYFGTFEHMQSFPSPRAGHSEAELDAGRDAGRNEARGGGQGELGALLQAKVGWLALRNEATFFRNDVSVPSGDTVWFDARLDQLVPAHGWTLTNDADLLFVSDFGLVVGARLHVTDGLYDDDMFQPGEPTVDPNGPAVRAGPLVAYTFFERPGAKLDRPTLLLLANWWIRHRYRTGIETNQGVPLVVLGFAASGDLWGSR